METTDALFAQYAEETMGKVFYFCLKKTGSSHEAEDLTSEISLCILQALRRGAQPVCLSAYVWQIARNRYRLWAIRKRRAGLSAPLEEQDGADAFRAEDEVVNSEQLALLRRELAFIASDYRSILVAYYILDEKTADIALRLGLSESTVRSRLFRARRILKEGMEMSRTFGRKSYAPEEITFVASGSQPSGLPWNAIRRKAPKNILLQASENPSTAEELSMELGIALPYMEEELALLVQATLLKKEGPRYVTNFVILDSECQQELYKTQRRRSKERSALIDRLADALVPKVRELNAVRNDMTDSDVKWWLVLRILDYCIVQGKHFNENWPKERENGETWGIVGYEQTELPESLLSGHNGFGPMHATFWTYKISDYNMWERCGEMAYDEVFLLADLIHSSRRLTELKGLETELWQQIEGRFAHAGTDGSVIPDILVFEPGTQRALYTALREHALYGELKAELEDVFDAVLSLLKSRVGTALHEQLTYCTSSTMYNLRMMTIHDEVESGRLIVPADPSQSTAAMWLALTK